MTYTPKWCTAADVLAANGQTVTDAQIQQAVMALELHAGLIEGVTRPDIADRDLYWLKQAVAYQTVWIIAQPDYLERNLVTSASQDGQSAAIGPDGLTLAPLARKALRRLSWQGMRSLEMDPRLTLQDLRDARYNDRLRARIDGGGAVSGIGYDPLADSSDALTPWSSL